MPLEFKIGDKVICKSRPTLSPATIQSFWEKSGVAFLMYGDGSREGVRVELLLPYVDPRDIEIAALKARLAHIDAVYAECAAFAQTPMSEQTFESQWSMKLEWLYAAVGSSKSLTAIIEQESSL